MEWGKIAPHFFSAIKLSFFLHPYWLTPTKISRDYDKAYYSLNYLNLRFQLFHKIVKINLLYTIRSHFEIAREAVNSHIA